AAAGAGSVVHSSLSFDLTVTSLYLPLIAGRPVTLVAPGADIDDLARLLGTGDPSAVDSREQGADSRREFSLLKLTPAHLEVLEQQLNDVDLTGHVRGLVIGG